MRTSIPRRIAALTLAAAVMIGASACTASPPGTDSGASIPSGGADGEGDGGQSTADACALVQDTITDATAEFEQAADADPAAVVDAMQAAAAKLGDAAADVTNDEVAAILPPLQEMFTETGEVMAAIVAGDVGKLGDLSELGSSFQETSQAFQELCAP